MPVILIGENVPTYYINLLSKEGMSFAQHTKHQIVKCINTVVIIISIVVIAKIDNGREASEWSLDNPLI